jgi:hypothetical protein
VGTQRLDLVSPSGARVTVDLPAEPAVASVVAGVRFAGGSYGTGLQIGVRGYHDFACRHVSPATTRERFVVSGREVVVAEAVDGSCALATMIGTHHELMTVYAGPAPARERVAALFSSLKVTDGTAGMVVRPRAATLLDLMSEQVIVAVPGRGSVCVPGPREARTMVPRHAGARTRHGEVWKLAYPNAGEGAYAFILGCPAGAAQVHLRSGDAASLDWLDGIDVAWRG